MKSTRYAAVPQSAAEDGHFSPGARRTGDADGDADGEGSGSGSGSWLWYERAKRALYLSSLAMLTLVMGFCLGRNHDHLRMGGGGHSAGKTGAGGGLLPAQAFLPESTFFGGGTSIFCR